MDTGATAAAEEQKLINGNWLAEFLYRDADAAPYLLVHKKLDEKGKRHFIQHHLEGGQWVPKKPEGPRIPYCLPELLAAPFTTIVYFAEVKKMPTAFGPSVSRRRP
jgi:hypothetical protein